jgi:hypothetical protein
LGKAGEQSDSLRRNGGLQKRLNAGIVILSSRSCYGSSLPGCANQ